MMKAGSLYTPSPRRFGFAILQAFPGPNFAFAAYLGFLSVPFNPVLGALLGYLGIFTPGILLKLALLPLYKSWREYAIAKSALRGLNAAAVGLIYTAVWQLFLGESRSSVSQPWLGAEFETPRSRSHLHFGRGDDGLDRQRRVDGGSLVGRRRGGQLRRHPMVSRASSRVGVERGGRWVDLVWRRQVLMSFVV